MTALSKPKIRAFPGVSHAEQGDVASREPLRLVIGSPRDADRLRVHGGKGSGPRFLVGLLAVEVEDEDPVWAKRREDVGEHCPQLFALHDVVQTVERGDCRVETLRQTE